MKLGRLATFVAAAAVVLATASTAALAGPHVGGPGTGVWAGKTHQDLPPLGPDADFVEWTQPIVVRTYAGRLTAVLVNVRYVCPHPTNPLAGDIPLYESWLLGKGPLLTKNGGFTLRAKGVSIRGLLGKGGASGRFEVAKPGCKGKGTWQAKRKF